MVSMRPWPTRSWPCPPESSAFTGTLQNNVLTWAPAPLPPGIVSYSYTIVITVTDQPTNGAPALSAYQEYVLAEEVNEGRKHAGTRTDLAIRSASPLFPEGGLSHVGRVWMIFGL